MFTQNAFSKLLFTEVSQGATNVNGQGAGLVLPPIEVSLFVATGLSDAGSH